MKLFKNVMKPNTQPSPPRERKLLTSPDLSWSQKWGSLQVRSWSSLGREPLLVSTQLHTCAHTHTRARTHRYNKETHSSYSYLHGHSACAPLNVQEQACSAALWFCGHLLMGNTHIHCQHCTYTPLAPTCTGREFFKLVHH